jgi:hypothetical protein
MNVKLKHLILAASLIVGTIIGGLCLAVCHIENTTRETVRSAQSDLETSATDASSDVTTVVQEEVDDLRSDLGHGRKYR